MSANALIAYAGGLPAFILIKVLAPAFFAREEPRVPVRIAILCVIVNACLNGILIWPLGHVGVALATSLSGWLNVALLLNALGRRGYYRPDARLKRRIPRMILAAAVMAGLLWLLIWALGDVFHATLPVRVGALAGLVVSGLIVYAALGRLVGAAHLGELRALFRKGPGRKESGA